MSATAGLSSSDSFKMRVEEHGALTLIVYPMDCNLVTAVTSYANVC